MLSHALNPIQVSDNRIVTSYGGLTMKLRGIVRPGLEYCGPEGLGSLAKAGITSGEITEIVQGWKSNIVRLPFNQAWALQRAGYDPEPYLSALDFVIDCAAANGAYTLLDLQWLDAVTPRGRNLDGSDNFVPPLPTLDTIQVWRQIASRYRNEPAVLYDIFNEPHDPLSDDPVGISAMRPDGTVVPLFSGNITMSDWQAWASEIIRAIRSENPTALIFVSGLNWAYDLRGYPIAGLGNIVYSTHIYRNKGSDWNEAFGDLAQDYPVFAAEWGGGDQDVSWGEQLAEYLDQKNIGWTAWSWSDFPHLVQTPIAPPYAPTRFGDLVKSLLAS